MALKRPWHASKNIEKVHSVTHCIFFFADISIESQCLDAQMMYFLIHIYIIGKIKGLQLYYTFV